MNMLQRLFPGFTSRVAGYRGRLFERLFDTRPAAEAGGQIATTSRQLPRWVMILLGTGAFAFYGLLVVRAIRAWDGDALRDMHLWPAGILIATAIQMIGYLMLIWNWGRLFSWLGHRLHFLQHLKVYAYSGLANKLPGFFWSIATRLFLYGRYQVPATTTAVGIGLEILLMGVASSLLSLALFAADPGRALFLPLPVVLGALAVCLLATHPRILRLLLARIPNQNLLNALAKLTWAQILGAIGGYAAIIFLGGNCLFWIVCAVVGVRSDLYMLALQTWAITMTWSTLLAWLPADFGLRQGPFLVLLATVFPEPLVLVLLLVWRFWFNAMELMWGAAGVGVALLVEKHLPESHHD